MDQIKVKWPLQHWLSLAALVVCSSDRCLEHLSFLLCCLGLPVESCVGFFVFAVCIGLWKCNMPL